MTNKSNKLKSVPAPLPRGETNANEEFEACVEALGDFIETYTPEEMEDPWLAEQVAILTGALENGINLYAEHTRLLAMVERFAAQQGSGLVVPG